MKDTMSCSVTVECAKYTWKEEPWETCTPTQPGKQCGPGSQRRTINCYSITGQLVSDKRFVADLPVLQYLYSKTRLLRPPFGLRKNGLYSGVVLINEMGL